MQLTMLCVATHVAVPAFVPGLRASLTDGCFDMPETPALLRRLSTAIRERALALDPPPSWDEIEAEVTREWLILTSRIDAALAARGTRLAG